MTDLFDYRSSYPETAGYKAEGTSQAAAATVDAKTLQRQVLKTLSDAGPLTADQCAAKMGLSILSVRPRLSELKRLGKIVDTGIRHPNASGRSAAVFRLS